LERFTDAVGEGSPVPKPVEKGEVEEKGWEENDGPCYSNREVASVKCVRKLNKGSVLCWIHLGAVGVVNFCHVGFEIEDSMDGWI
jgi:hypothetical protein